MRTRDKTLNQDIPNHPVSKWTEKKPPKKQVALTDDNC